TKIAGELGETLAKRNMRIVYGGTKIGLMGKMANAALENNGEVIGVIPDFLTEKELAHDKLTQLILVESMHERKIRMHEFSDGVIALPGGFGTMDEFFEMLTWGQLGLHKKPMGQSCHCLFKLFHKF
ncbi:MAG: TIGR00730 family Rossman fold protein, partial [Desulfobacterales bacterium]